MSCSTCSEWGAWALGLAMGMFFTILIGVIIGSSPDATADRHCKALGHNGASIRRGGQIVCWDVAVTEAK